MDTEFGEFFAYGWGIFQINNCRQFSHPTDELWASVISGRRILSPAKPGFWLQSYNSKSSLHGTTLQKSRKKVCFCILHHTSLGLGFSLHTWISGKMHISEVGHLFESLAARVAAEQGRWQAELGFTSTFLWKPGISTSPTSSQQINFDTAQNQIESVRCTSIFTQKRNTREPDRSWFVVDFDYTGFKDLKPTPNSKKHSFPEQKMLLFSAAQESGTGRHQSV